MAYSLVLIEVCDANRACVPELFNLEAENVSVSVIENSCMSECELCAANPYVFLNGEIVSADSLESLLQTVRERVNELIKAYNSPS